MTKQDKIAAIFGIGLNAVVVTIVLFASTIFIASILAFPAPWKQKILGILLGILAIQCFNIIRIGVLFYLGLHHRALFETVHVYVAQSILIAVAAALWLFWSAWVGKQPEVESR